MKVKFNAGAEMDILNASEVREELAQAAAAWRKELARGVRFVKFSGTAVVSGGTWTLLPESGDNRLGPNEGFIWSVTRVGVDGNGIVMGTDVFRVYVGEIAPSKFVQRGTNALQFDPSVLVLNGGEELALTGAGTGGAGTDVHVSGQAIELPAQLAWQLL